MLAAVAFSYSVYVGSLFNTIKTTPLLESKYLDEIHPAVDNFRVNVKFDRSFNRKVIHFVSPSGVPMKEVVSVDIVLYDEQVCVDLNSHLCFDILYTVHLLLCFVLDGLRDLDASKLRSEESRDRFMRKIHPDAIFEVINPSVECGGEGVNDHYQKE